MRKALVMSLFGLLVWGTITAAHAGPRVTEINSRMEEQSGRIQHGKGKHKMSVGQQTRADEADYRIAAQEQAMRGRHNGKLTKHDQRVLNRKLNRNSRRIQANKH
jgi:hypothetical protein